MKNTSLFKRCMVMLLCFCMIAGNFTFASAAADYDSAVTENVVSADGTCPHHTAHTADCGYKAATEEVPCDKGCTDTDGDGFIDHADGCAYQAAEEALPCGYKCEICIAADAQIADSDDGESDTDSDDGSNSVMLTSLDGEGEPAAQSDDAPTEFTPSKVIIQKLVDNVWTDAAEFTEDDSVKVNLDFTLAANSVNTSNTIYYQLPTGALNIGSNMTGDVKGSDGTTVYGTYTVDTSGKVTIVFNDSFDHTQAFTGNLWFQSTIAEIGEETQKQFQFGTDGTTITVKKKAAVYDIAVEKTANQDSANQKIDYTVTVSTTNGTEGAVKIEDTFSVTRLTAEYDRNSFALKKISTGGEETTMSVSPTFAEKSFAIEDLPKLSAGEKYVLTYSMPYALRDGGNSYKTVENKVTASSGEDNASDTAEKTIGYTVLNKIGNKNDDGSITWTIEVNEDKFDIAGWTLSDIMTQTDKNGEYISDKFDFTSVTMTSYDSNGSIVDSNFEIELPYTFKPDSNGKNTKKYTISYTIKLKDEYSDWQGDVCNTAYLTKNGVGSFEYSRIIGIYDRDWEVKKTHGRNVIYENGLYANSWTTTVTIPNGNRSEITFTDTVIDVNNIPGSHYQKRNEGIDSLRLTLEDDKIVDLTKDNSEFEYKQTFFDADGKEIAADDSQTKAKTFKVTIKRKDGGTFEAKKLICKYTTLVDYSGFEEGTITTVWNTSEIEEHTASANSVYMVPVRLKKIGGDTYSESTKFASISAGESVALEPDNSGKWSKELYYTLNWYNLGDSGTTDSDILVLTDTLPEGLEFVEVLDYGFADSNKFYGKTNGSYTIGNLATETQKLDDSRTQVTFKINGPYYCKINNAHNYVRILYKVKVADDSYWDNLQNSEKTYTNTASWSENGSAGGSASVDVPVTRTIDKVYKYMTQESKTDISGTTEILDNKVTYCVTINPTGEMLANGNSITLTDTLTIGSSGAQAELGDVRLYYLDYLGASNIPVKGELIDSSRYYYTYDEATHTIKVTLEDGLACVLEYVYSIDMANFNEVSLSNSATLNGQYSASSDTKVRSNDSGASGSQGALNIRKIDALNREKSLAGATFKLEKFVNGAWTAETVLDAGGNAPTGGVYTVGDDGILTFNTLSAETGTSLLVNTLYCLTEETAPSGYIKDETSYYFVVMKGGETAETTKTAMGDDITASGVDWSNVKFVANNLTASIDVPNTSTKLTVKKVWVGSDGKTMTSTPDSVTVALYQNGTQDGDAVTLNAENNWSYTWNNLSGSGYSVKEISVTKGSEAAEVAENGTVTVDGDTYNVSYRENTTTTGNAFSGEITITNRKQPGKTTISGVKTWVDGDNWDSSRPESVTVTLMQNGEVTDKTAELNKDNGWKYSFADLPEEDDNGARIKYSVTEDAVAGYTTTYSGYNIINTYNTPKPAELSIPVEKKIDGDTPATAETFTFTLSAADGTPMPSSNTVTISGANSASFGTIKYTAAGEYTYTVKETQGSAEGYKYDSTEHSVVVTVTQNDDNTLSATWTLDGAAADKVTFTNTYTKPQPKTGSIEISKTVNGDTGYDPAQKFTFTVDLKNASGEALTDSYSYIIYNADNSESGSGSISMIDSGNAVSITAGQKVVISDIPDGAKYTVTETEVTNFSASVNGTAGNTASGTVSGGEAVTIAYTNTFTMPKTSVTVKKVWNDANDQDGKRPESITVKLMNGSTEVQTITLTKSKSWTATVSDLPEYTNGVKNSYTWEEVETGLPEGYSLTGTSTEGSVTTLTNSYTPETTDIEVTKTWDDGDNRDNKRPDSITVTLVKNSEATTQTVTLTAADNWASKKFEDLPVYENGKAITYTVQEEVPSGYSVSYSGTYKSDIKNSYSPETRNIQVTKSWVDGNNKDNSRPNEVVVQLYANGTAVENKTLTLTSGNNWTGSFEGLAKMADGKEIEYSVKEVSVTGYSSAIAGDMTQGFTITNTKTTEVSGKKIWYDGDNKGNTRPTSIMVTLYADGVIAKYVSVSGSENWTYSFTGLAKYDANGSAIEYSVSEDAVSGYRTVIDGYNITNILLTDISVSKTWDDGDNQDGKRPTSITVNLMAVKSEGGAKEKVETVEIKPDANGSWAYTFTGLDKFNGDFEIQYSVEETSVTDYTTEITGDMTSGFTITNKHTPETTSVTVTKTWVDANDWDNKRPTSITVTLVKNGTATEQTVELKAADDWEAKSFVNLPVYEKGQEITYTVQETVPEGYEASYSGYAITNTYAPKPVSLTIPVEKVISGAAPETAESFTFKLEKVTENAPMPSSDTVTITGAGENSFGSITYTQEGTYEYKLSENSGTATGYGYDTTVWNIAVTVTKNTDNTLSLTWTADGKSVDTVTFTNSYTKPAPGSLQIPVEKVIDGDPRTGDVKQEFTFTLTKVTENAPMPESATVTIRDAGKANFGAIQFTQPGKYEYTLTETDSGAAGYTYDTTERKIVVTVTKQADNTLSAAWTVNGESADTVTFTNSYKAAPIDISGTKTWDDVDDQDGKRPTSITVNLMAVKSEGGTKELVKSVDVTEGKDGSWTYSFTGLPRYNKGFEIQYSIEETAVADYSTEITGYDITNKHIPETIDISGTKTWDDVDDQDGKRPTSITVNLMAVKSEGGTKELVKSVDVTEGKDGSWTYSFTGLPRYNKGFKIQYSIEETEVADYSTEITGYDVTNKHIPETIDISGTKTWDDAGNQDGKRPTSITVNLMAVKSEGGTKELVKSVDVMEGEDGSWTYSFTGLPRYNNGFEIQYSIEETAVADYSTEITGYDITNKHIPETIDISGTKTWDDVDDQDGKRPTSITVNLMAVKSEGGTKELVKSVDVTEGKDGSWTYSFTGLARYDKGFEIQYSIEETEVADYSTEITGYDITNKHIPETIDISGTKTWDDAGNQDGKRPTSITVNLMAVKSEGGTKELVKSVDVTEGKDGSWTYSFTGLPRYNKGFEIQYSIEETAVADYSTEINGYDITNKHIPETIDISGTKTWDDVGDQDGKRPTSITIRLLADGVEKAVETVTETSGWKWSFTDMPKFADGKEISYTITEDAVEGYQAAVDGFNVTNSYTPGKVSVYVTKSWQDGGNLDGIRPKTVTIELLADGKETGKSLTLNADCNWTGCFADLDEYQNGQKIVYTVEENWVFGYSCVITGDMATGFVVTNCHTPIRLRTGDDSDIALWAALAGLSATGLVGAGISVNRKKRKDGADK